MKKNLLIAAALGFALAQTGFAQGAWEKIVLIAKGSYAQTTVVSVGTSGSVLIASANTGKRADLTCRNNSAFTLYIGTNAAGTTLTGVGFPVLTNETFELGAFSDSVYGIGSGGTVDTRCWEGAIR